MQKQKKLKRNVNMGFRVTAEEQSRIMERMKTVEIPSVRAYMLNMALYGEVKTIDLSDVRECSRLLKILGNNVNQLAKRVNEGGSVYAEDVADIRERLEAVWEQQDKIIRTLAKILEAA